MGYTHYFKFLKPVTDEAKRDVVKVVKKIVAEHKAILSGDTQFGENPHVSENLIWLNGIEQAAHETFAINFIQASNSGDFVTDFRVDRRNSVEISCKTARKNYDRPVMEILLALFNLVPGFELKSDGDFNAAYWTDAYEHVKTKYGLMSNPAVPKNKALVEVV